MLSNLPITQQRLQELLHYDRETGVFTWKIRMGRGKKGSVAGCSANGYRQISFDGKFHKAHRLAWLYVYGYLPEKQVDHIDRVRDHNWISNLREVSSQCNLRNTGNFKDNTSGVKGVYWFPATKTWSARITINRKTITIGYRRDFMEAVCLRLAAEQAEDWEGCDNSSPAYKYVMEGGLQCCTIATT